MALPLPLRRTEDKVESSNSEKNRRWYFFIINYYTYIFFIFVRWRFFLFLSGDVFFSKTPNDCNLQSLTSKIQ
jgi:hypothetical protein